MAPPDFDRSVNPISTKGDRLCPPNDTGTHGFSNLPTALPACYKLNGRRSFGCTQTKLFDKGMYVWIAQRLKILTVF